MEKNGGSGNVPSEGGNLKATPQEVGDFLAQAYISAFGPDEFHDIFDNESLGDGQSMDSALAEWHAFGCFIFTHCLWVTYRSRSKVVPILDHFRPALLNLLSLSKTAESTLLDIALDREKEYVARFQAAKDGTDLMVFFSRVIARITGDFDADLDSKGIPQTSNIVTNLGLSAKTSVVIALTMSALKQCSLE
jgi:hypothetical protein